MFLRSTLCTSFHHGKCNRRQGLGLSQSSDPAPPGTDRDHTDSGRTIVEVMGLLRRRGFGQSMVRDQHTSIEAVMFNRVWRGVRDTVLAYSENEALAYRVRDAEVRPADPFTVDPDRKVWHCGGEFLDVSTQLLNLPPPPGHSKFGS